MNVALTPQEVAPGIAMLSVRTPTLPPATHTNAYLVGMRECVLVEPASAEAVEIDKLLGWVEARCQAGARLRAVLLTHHHHDHVGGAGAVSARLNVPIWAHAATAERLAGKVAVQRSLDHGERITLDGAEPLTLECVHTPGHAPGHLCFWAREARALIAGDMVASVGTILVDTKDGDMQRYLDSLRAMDELDAQQLLPAHGLPIHDARARLHYYVQHRLAREAKVYAALADLGRAARSDELLPRAYADTPKAAWPFAALAIEAHLVKLEREERVERQGATWRAR